MDSQGIGALGDIQAQMGGGQQLSGQSLGVSKIIMHYFQNRGIPLSAGMQGVQQQIQQGLKLIQHRNSVMGLKMLSPDSAQIHFFTTGTETTLMQDIQYFVSELKRAGIRTIYDSEADPTMVKAIQALGAQIQQSDNPKYKLKATL